MLNINYQELINTYIKNCGVGSSIVQVILFSEKIEKITAHLKKFKKDLHSTRGLINIVNKRKNLLKYIKNTDKKDYFFIINLLKLRK